MKIVHKRNDGGVSITTLAITLTEEELQKHIEKLEKQHPEYISSRIIEDDSLIPTDRTFRNAWTDDLPTETVDVDVSKAKELHKDTLRQLRKPKLEALDVELIKALEKGDTTTVSVIAAKKQELRDVTKVSLPDDLEQLKNTIPNCLKG